MDQIKPSDLTTDQLALIVEYGSRGPHFELEHEDTGPGKFEGNHNPGLAERIYQASLEGWNDDETGTVEWDYHVSLIGRFLLFENTQGFVTLEEHESDTDARKAFDEIDDAYCEWEDED